MANSIPTLNIPLDGIAASTRLTTEKLTLEAPIQLE